MFRDRPIHITDFDDVNGERVIEFADVATDADEVLMAVHNSGERWSDAKVSISPKVVEVPAEFMAWALQIARRTMHP